MKHLVTISQFASVLPISIGLSKWNRSKRIIHVLILILAAWLIAEIIQFVTRANNVHNLWISYALTPLQLVLIGLYYHYLTPQRRRFVAVVFGLGLAIAFGEMLSRPWDQLNSISLLYQCFAIVLVGAISFYDMLGRGEFNYSWSNAGFILLFMGSAVYYSAFLKLDNINLLRTLSAGHTLLLLVVYGLLTMEVWKH